MNTTYKGDIELKKYMVKEAVAHRKSDELVKGTYGDISAGAWKGCAVGCAIKSLNAKLGTNHSTADHSFLEEQSLYPEWLARLQDTLFEGLPEKESQQWPERFTKAIPVGVSFKDLEPIRWKFCALILKENIERVLTLNIKDELKKQVVDAIQGVLTLHENALTTGVWDESAARSAARSAWSAAESAAYIKYAAELIRLLKEVK